MNLLHFFFVNYFWWFKFQVDIEGDENTNMDEIIKELVNK